MASLGTAFTSQHAGILKRYTDQVVLTYDSDGAGVKAALRAIPILREAGISSRVLNMKPYKDPDEFIKNLGAEAFRKRVEEAKNSFLFAIDVMKAGYSMEDPEQKNPVLSGNRKAALTVRGALGARQLPGGCVPGARDPGGGAAPPGKPHGHVPGNESRGELAAGRRKAAGRAGDAGQTGRRTAGYRGGGEEARRRTEDAGPCRTPGRTASAVPRGFFSPGL